MFGGAIQLLHPVAKRKLMQVKATFQPVEWSPKELLNILESTNPDTTVYICAVSPNELQSLVHTILLHPFNQLNSNLILWFSSEGAGIKWKRY